LERTLDDSANRRTSLPEPFLIADELLRVATRICEGLRVDEATIARNFAAYGPFAATERVLMALVKAGADRQEMHARIRDLTLDAWESLRRGEPNPLVEQVAADPEFLRYLPESQLRALMDASGHIGDAPLRARSLAGQIRQIAAA
jgi:adenylosuccinate lyase